MSKKNSNATTKSNKGAAKKLVIKRILGRGRDEFGGAVSRTARIETFLLLAKAPVKIKEIETALSDVKCIRNHIATLYSKQLVNKDENGRYFVRPEVRSKLAKKS